MLKDLVAALEQEGRPMTAAELVAATGLPRSSVFRGIKDLTTAGILRQDEHTRKYGVGPVLLRLGLLAHEQLSKPEVLSPPLLELSRQTNETVSYSIAQVPYRVPTVSIEPPSEVRHIVQVGSRYPLPLGVAGKVILAFLSSDEIGGVLRWHGMTESQIDTARAELDEMRSAGFGRMVGHRLSAVAALAVPVFVGTRVVGSVAVAGPAERMNTNSDNALEDTISAAKAITKLLSDAV